MTGICSPGEEPGKPEKRHRLNDDFMHDMSGEAFAFITNKAVCLYSAEQTGWFMGLGWARARCRVHTWLFWRSFAPSAEAGPIAAAACSATASTIATTFPNATSSIPGLVEADLGTILQMNGQRDQPQLPKLIRAASNSAPPKNSH